MARKKDNSIMTVVIIIALLVLAIFFIKDKILFSSINIGTVKNPVCNYDYASRLFECDLINYWQGPNVCNGLQCDFGIEWDGGGVIKATSYPKSYDTVDYGGLRGGGFCRASGGYVRSDTPPFDWDDSCIFNLNSMPFKVIAYDNAGNKLTLISHTSNSMVFSGWGEQGNSFNSIKVYFNPGAKIFGEGKRVQLSPKTIFACKDDCPAGTSYLSASQSPLACFTGSYQSGPTCGGACIYGDPCIWQPSHGCCGCAYHEGCGQGCTGGYTSVECGGPNYASISRINYTWSAETVNCASYNTVLSCERYYGCYWYDNSCHATAQPPAPTTCVSDSDCVKVLTTCCPCNMGGVEKCVLEGTESQYLPTNCDPNPMCIAQANCVIDHCECVAGECVDVLEPEPEPCGDGYCGYEENINNCPKDCNECGLSETKCIDYDFYKCQDTVPNYIGGNKFVLYETNSAKCGYVSGCISGSTKCVGDNLYECVNHNWVLKTACEWGCIQE